MAGNTSFEEFSKIVVKAIEDEPFLNKETLAGKIKVLASAFKINLDSTKYKNIVSPTAHQKQLREIQKTDFEKIFWHRKYRELAGQEAFSIRCTELDTLLIEHGFKTK